MIYQSTDRTEGRVLFFIEINYPLGRLFFFIIIISISFSATEK